MHNLTIDKINAFWRPLSVVVFIRGVFRDFVTNWFCGCGSSVCSAIRVELLVGNAWRVVRCFASYRQRVGIKAPSTSQLQFSFVTESERDTVSHTHTDPGNGALLLCMFFAYFHIPLRMHLLINIYICASLAAYRFAGTGRIWSCCTGTWQSRGTHFWSTRWRIWWWSWPERRCGIECWTV